MKTIWKFPLMVADRQRVQMRAGAEVLSVGVQGGTIVLWALVDPMASFAEIEIIIHGTGHPADDVGGACFVGTVMYPHGLVFHVWEVPQ